MIFSLSLLFLQLEGDTSDGTTLDTFHEMGCVTGDLERQVNFCSRDIVVWVSRWVVYLISQSLRSDNGNFVAYPLVGLEVEGEFGVVSLDDDLGGLLDSLCSNTTHLGDWLR